MNQDPNRFANLSPLRKALLALEEVQARLSESERRQSEAVAIVGMGCRFPSAADPAQFWRLLTKGDDAVGDVPRSRWKIEEYYHPDPDRLGKIATRWGGYLEQIDQFDAEFFGISPREARLIDPQQRLLLEVAWEALENGGQNPSRLAECQTGVFIGITGDEFAHSLLRQNDPSLYNAYFASGIARSVAAGRISYSLGLQGPNLSLDTACSSSLVALHTACLHLRAGECRIALAGGVNVLLGPEILIAFSKAHMLAADGRCKTFDARADGFVRGEGCGMVVLKRLSDAEADGDRILAVIRGSAVNQDGRSSGLTVPNGVAQEALLKQALANARVSAEEIGYVEAHGTGTSLGDPIEAHALARVLGKGRSAENPLVVGSVKTNLGHLEAAAGVAGLIKVVLSLEEEWIPQHLHFEKMNPHIDWQGVPVEIPVEGKAWRRGGKRRLAGVSSFGFSGTNAHVIVEEAPVAAERKREYERPQHILALSARSASALEKLVERYAEELSHTTAEVGDICYTANAGRAHFDERLVVVGSTAEQLRSKLLEAKAGQRAVDRDGIRAVFLFPGQGSQYAGMGKELYETQPVFRRKVEECAELLKSELEEPLLEVLWGAKTELLEQTAYTQPALFAIEYGLAELWKSWGIEPSAVLGHSVGEYVAACVAGVYSLADGLKLIAARGRLMQQVAGQGAMASVGATEERVREALKGFEERVSVAGVNARESVVISGYEREVGMVEERLRREGIRVQRLAVSHGFHSPQMREMEEAFEGIARQIRFAAPRVRLISSVTGKVIGREELSEGGYWRRQVREPVRFQAAIETLAELGYRVFVEAGPGTVLSGLGRQTLTSEDILWGISLKKKRAEWETLLEALGRLYVRGAEINWAGFDQPYQRRRVALPTYPFERQRYWIDEKPHQSSAASVAGTPSGHPLLGSRIELASDPQTHVWENRISLQTLPYLADHCAFGKIIFPLTAYLEMMTSAIMDSTSQASEVREVVVFEPLFLEADKDTTVQLVQKGDRIEIFSRKGAEWKRHAGAKISASQPLGSHEPFVALEQRLSNFANMEDFYASIRNRGMQFGPCFRSISGLQFGSGESLAHVTLSAISGDTAAYGIHPALLDGCFQALAAVLPGDSENLYLPVGIERFARYRSAAGDLRAHVKLLTSESQPNVIKVDVSVSDQAGIVAEAVGMQLRRATAVAQDRHALVRTADDFFELSWESNPLPIKQADLRGNWLILADIEGISDELARRVAEGGGDCTLLHRPVDLRQAVATKVWRGVIYLWGMEAIGEDSLEASGLGERLHRICGGALDLVQSLAESHEAASPRLWLVTRGSQAVNKQEPIAVAQATLWGSAQAISEEHPKWECTCIDLDPKHNVDCLPMLFEEIRTASSEEQIAIRDGERFVARLTPKPRVNGLDQPQRLFVSTRGVLDGLQLESAVRRPVQAGHIEIQVDASGLNFRDVLNVLGMYPGDPGPLGSECAGHVIAAGDGIDQFRQGDEVIAMVSGGHDGFVRADARIVARKPSNLTPEQAATIPTAFLTARYTLEYLAKIRPGDRVLIHAATGGVGLAAVQIAQRAGAEIFATAGSEHKRSVLRGLGVQHIMNSRTLDFARQILDETNGRGVDIVLNSLADEFIPASLSVLTNGGRFLEIGKRGIWSQEEVDRLGRDLQYWIVDLGQVAVNRPDILGCLLEDTVSAIERGELTPLPKKVFSFRDAVSAFRHMAQAQHIGKVILRQDTCGANIRRDATYLVIGGLGGVGLHLGRWLVDRGARNVVLVGRSGSSPQAEEVVGWARERGAKIICRRADVSQKSDMADLLSEVADAMPPIRGIIHAGAVTADGALKNQSWSNFERVFAPKAVGSCILHELTASMPLDFFVLFSSVSALLGAPGIGNYSAANAFEDALAHERRRRGLPAISINWGAWAEGLTSRGGLIERFEQSGITAMSPVEGLALLDYILLDSPTQVGAGRFDWKTFVSRFGARPVPRRFSKLFDSKTSVERLAPAAQDLLKLLQESPQSLRPTVLRNHVHSLARRILGFPAGREIDVDRPLSELGMDSLMTVEFCNALSADIQRGVPATLLFGYPAISDITSYLAGLFSEADDSESFITAPAGHSADSLDDIEELSDEEVDRMLATKLGISG